MYLEEFSYPQPVVAPENKVMLDVCPWPVHAGFPSPAADHARKQIDLNEHLIRNKEATFIFRVKGDSMVGIGIYDGDELLVDRSIVPDDRSRNIPQLRLWWWLLPCHWC